MSTSRVNRKRRLSKNEAEINAPAAKRVKLIETKVKSTRNQNDKNELIFKEISNIEDMKEEILKKMAEEYRIRKQQITKEYDRYVEQLRKLSRDYIQCENCHECGIDGYDIGIVTCSAKGCNNKRCGKCMLRCEAGDGDECYSEEYYCSEECDQRVWAECCDRALCVGYCAKQPKRDCDRCGDKVCDSCVTYKTRVEEWGQSPFEIGHVVKAYCKDCHKNEDDDLYYR